MAVYRKCPEETHLGETESRFNIAHEWVWELTAREREASFQGDAKGLRLEFTEFTENRCTLSFMDANYTSVKLFKQEPEAHH